MDYFDRIVATAKDIFSGMLLMEITPETPVPSGMNHQHSISGVIGLAGRGRGMLAVHTPREVAKAITGGFLGMAVTEFTDDVKDAIGELANMLAGDMKLTLVENGSDIRLSTPSVICGDAYALNSPDAGIGIVVPFQLPEGRFFIEFHWLEGED